MISSCFTRTALTVRATRSASSCLVGSFQGLAAIGNNNGGPTNQQQALRTKSTSSKKSSFRPRRAPTKGGYYSRLDRSRAESSFKRPARKGPREPNDVKTEIPRIDKSQIRVRDALGIDDLEENDDDLVSLGPLMGGALRKLRQGGDSDWNDLETQLKLMDFFTSEDGSTEDLVGARRAVAADTSSSASAEAMLQAIDELVERERFEYMELPKSDDFEAIQNSNNSDGSSSGAASFIPHNQLAHGDWGEMLIRTDRVSKMWRGGRVVSFRALVIGGNLRGCGGFGLGKAFEPEDAVEIACRMAKRNIFFVDRFKGRTLTRDLVGRQNSCKVVLRTTTNGLRGNPLCCEILKLMGITNVVAKAYGSRNHYNVVRATYKALLTHESLDEVALKRGLRLVNLQRAKRLGI